MLVLQSAYSSTRAQVLPGPVYPKRAAVAAVANADGSGFEQRIAVIETKLDNLKALDDRVSKLNDKIDALSLQLAAVNTKLQFIQWFGGAFGLMVLAYLWNSVTGKRGAREAAISEQSYRRSDLDIDAILAAARAIYAERAREEKQAAKPG